MSKTIGADPLGPSAGLPAEADHALTDSSATSGKSLSNDVQLQNLPHSGGPVANDQTLPDEAVNAIRRGFEAISQIQRNNEDERRGVTWLAVIDLGYVENTRKDDESGCYDCCESVCFTCGKDANLTQAKQLLKCSQCMVASYCSKACQLADWKNGTTANGSAGSSSLPHKRICAAYKRIGPSMKLSNEVDQRTVREEILNKIRFYASPYAVHNMSVEGIGRGFLFLQSDFTLAQLSLPTGADILRRRSKSPRSVLLHYLTLGEYDQELCRDDFELACVRNELKKAIESYELERQVVYLMRFRCGHLALCVAPLVPDYKLSCKLAKEYYGNQQQQCQPIQLNLDDD
jgi:hypothetical protein